MNNCMTNDYVGLAIQNNIKLEKIYLESVLEVFECEKNIIDHCLEAGMITLEALTETEVEVTKKRSILQRIMDALNALFGKFKEKIKILSDKNNEWLKKNLVHLTPKNFKELPEIEAYPLWQRSHTEIMADLQKIANGVVNQTKEKQPNLEGIEEVVRKSIGGKDSLGKDAITFFRSGKPNEPLKAVKINGEQLSEYFQDMYGYAVKYDKLVVPAVQKFMNQVQNIVKTIAPPEATEESFCYIEGIPYSDSLLGMLPNPYGSLVLEETADEEVKNGKINDNKKDDEGPSSVTSVRLTEDGKDNKDKAKQTYDTQYVKDITNVLKILQGAALTVLEERYLLCISIFKAVLKNAGINQEGKAKDDKPQDSDKKDDNEEK